MMELLSIRGRTDVGLDLAFQTDYPSWGYSLGLYGAFAGVEISRSRNRKTGRVSVLF